MKCIPLKFLVCFHSIIMINLQIIYSLARMIISSQHLNYFSQYTDITIYRLIQLLFVEYCTTYYYYIVFYTAIIHNRASMPRITIKPQYFNMIYLLDSHFLWIRQVIQYCVVYGKLLVMHRSLRELFKGRLTN